MSVDLRKRSLLSITDLSSAEFQHLIDLSGELKRARAARQEKPRLMGRNMALIFEKTSTRTRCSFEVAAFDQGMHVTYLDPTGSQIGHKESIKDTARVLGRYYDCIEYRGYEQAVVEALALHAGVPVYNGLTDDHHPLQMLADFMTMAEHGKKPFNEIAYAYLGDARNNMGNSLLLSGCLMGADVRLVAPKALWPEERIITQARALAERTGARMTLTEDVAAGVRGCDFIHTDVWLSMGEPPARWAERIQLLLPYQVNAGVMKAAENLRVRFMHCLPAFHNTETKIGRELSEKYGLTALEVTEEVFESDASVAFDQAENRLHTTKALLVATLAD